MSGKIEIDPIVYEGKEQKYMLLAEENDARNSKGKQDYHEMFVGFYDKKLDKCVADIYFTVDHDTKEPVVFITARGDGDGDHVITVYPLRAPAQAVEVDHR